MTAKARGERIVAPRIVAASMRAMNERKSSLLQVILMAANFLLVSVASEAAVGPWERNKQGRVRLVSPLAVAERGEPLPLGVEFHTAEGWHVYWLDAGDAGYAPKVTGLEPPDLVGVDLKFPAPRRFSLPGDLEAIGYEGTVIYPLSERVLRERAEVIHAAIDLDYLTCADECLPHRYTLEITIPQGDVSVDDPDVQADFAAFRAAVPLDFDPALGVTIRESRLIAGSASEEQRLILELEGVRGGTETDLFFLPQDVVDIERPIVHTTPNGVRYELAFSPRRVDQPLPEPLELSWVATELAPASFSDVRKVAIAGRSPFSIHATSVASRRPGTSAPIWTLVALVAWGVALAAWGFAGGRSRTAPLGFGRALIGFAALAFLIEALRRLGSIVPPFAIAGFELGLLAAALALWWRGRARSTGAAVLFVLLALTALGLGVAAILAVFGKVD